MFSKHLISRPSLHALLPALFAQQTQDTRRNDDHSVAASPRMSSWTSPRHPTDAGSWAAFCDRRSWLRRPRRCHSSHPAAPIRISMSGA